VHNVVTQLKSDGRVTRGWLGVTIQDIDKNLAESFGLKRPRGALIAQVAPDSPAEKGGLQDGDVIINFDGKDIPTSSDLPHVVGLIEPGKTVPVEIVRDQKRKTLKIKVGGLDADDSYALTSGSGDKARGGKIGLVVETASPEAMERAAVDGGVVVREVVPGSPAAQAGVLPGDVLTMIGSTPVKSAKAFESAVGKLKDGASVPLRLIRRGSPLFIGLKLDK
jgi:serine protease Do